MNLPFNDLQRIHNPIREELEEAFQRVLGKNSYILGEEVERFEESFARYLGFSCGEHAAGVSNGTDALELILRVFSLGEGDEIIIPANTFNATASAVRAAGATPVFADVGEDYLIDCCEIERLLTERTRAIIPVHLYGQQADMTSLKRIADRYRLLIIEDACQAHGSLQNGTPPGHVGNAAAFSFYPGKNLGTLGDGGMVVSRDRELISKIKKMRNYGQSRKYYHDEPGFNRRLDGMQAAFLNVKLNYLDQWNNSRIESVGKLTELLRDVEEVVLPSVNSGNKHAFHLYVVQTAQPKQRGDLEKYLNENGIQTGIHYPVPVHLQNAFASLHVPKGSLPMAEQFADRILSLPLFPFMREEEIKYLASTITFLFKMNLK